jgi:hypothetical protein
MALALEFLLKTGQDLLPVQDRDTRVLVGALSERDVLRAFEQRFREEQHRERYISIRDEAINVLKTGKKVFDYGTGRRHR